MLMGVGVTPETKKVTVFSHPRHHDFFHVEAVEAEWDVGVFNSAILGNATVSADIARSGTVMFNLVLSKEVPEDRMYFFADVGLDEMTFDSEYGSAYVAKMGIGK